MDLTDEVEDGNHYFDQSRAPARGRFVVPTSGLPRRPIPKTEEGDSFQYDLELIERAGQIYWVEG